MPLLTFDIEDWYLSYHSSQISADLWPKLEYRTEKNTLYILEVLEALQIRATFFVLGYEAKKNPRLLQRIHLAGHDLGFHSMGHVPPFAMTPRQFENDLCEGIKLFEDTTGERPWYYRAPMFSVDHRTPWVPELLAASGFKVSSSVHGGIRFQGIKLPKEPFVWKTSAGTLIEFPMPARRLGHIVLRVTGSGYFRMLPLWFLRSYLLKRVYHMFYFHPRDFDILVPTSPLLPAYRNVMNRLGNRTTTNKLKHLATRFHFQSLSQALESLPIHDLPALKVL